MTTQAIFRQRNIKLGTSPFSGTFLLLSFRLCIHKNKNHIIYEQTLSLSTTESMESFLFNSKEQRFLLEMCRFVNESMNFWGETNILSEGQTDKINSIKFEFKRDDSRNVVSWFMSHECRCMRFTGSDQRIDWMHVYT